MNTTLAFAAYDSKSALRAFSFPRRDPGPTDVQIDILYCGVCHSDLHTVRSEWAGTVYPCVVGHEIVGRVTKVGPSVKRYKAGDAVGVGCMVDSCQTCAACRNGFQQYCDNGGVVWTYNSPDRHLPGRMTCGGYSSQIVVDEGFVLRIPEKMDLKAAAPLLCAGITTYSPLRHWKAGPGRKVGVVGLGGLGHMGVKLSHAMGARTVMITTSPGKAADVKRLGADEVIVSTDSPDMAKHAASFDLILNTLAVSHSLDVYIALLNTHGTMCMLGAPEKPHPSPNVSGLVHRRRSLAGSLIGGIPETQEMLDFCAERGIASDIELIPIQKINEAYERMLRGDVKYRFVIDLASLKNAAG